MFLFFLFIICNKNWQTKSLFPLTYEISHDIYAISLYITYCILYGLQFYVQSGNKKTKERYNFRGGFEGAEIMRRRAKKTIILQYFLTGFRLTAPTHVFFNPLDSSWHSVCGLYCVYENILDDYTDNHHGN